MIFVGSGALLWRAVRHAGDRGHVVDLVCTAPGRQPADPGVGSNRLRYTEDVNELAGDLRAACTDGVVWSIDNKFIFRAPVLDLGLRIRNVHGGLLPDYRGLPLATVPYALLNGEAEYGATLHEVVARVDAGAVLAEERFPVDPEDTFEDVMMELVEACHTLFVDNLDDVVAGRETPRPQPSGGAYYGLRALHDVVNHRSSPNYSRATDLGMFEDYYPEAAQAWR
ncbi:MAG TPA: formyltransferase family protein [Pseudonocardia sp.]|jgi:methionyl-tRNA formyltransferase